MKKIILIIGIIIITLFSNMSVFAQQDGPGNPGGEPTGSDPPLGGGAPIGGGTLILIGLGAAYAGKKIYDIITEEKEEI